jgi:replicative DNA helicase
MTSGMHGGELILLAARPAMGKSALALNIASYCAINRGITTAVFSLEMPKIQLVKRIMSSVSKVSAGEINTGAIEPDAWGELMEGARKIAESGLVLDDTSGVTLMDLRSKCRKLKLEKNLGLIIIDYLQLMTGEKNAESRQNEIAGISRGLKVLARELDVPILALSQLSRGVESRTDKRPMLSDLRESGAIEQDADVVLFIYRDDYYNKESKEKGIAEVIISKQRSGPTGVVKLVWQPDYTRFRNISHEQ